MDIRIGTSGFSFPDWVGVVYPAGLNQREWLAYYERELGFSALEVNYTYYKMPSAKTLAAMSAKTSADFTFVVKAHRSMTHELWTDRKRHTMVDNRPSFESFLAGISPLAGEGKLSAVLAQFPYFFYRNDENSRYLARLPELLGDVPTVVEFRNERWHDEAALDLLRESGLGYCVVDEPKLKGLMPFNPVATTDLAYVRLHGRNRNWFGASVAERYDYRYSKEELTELLPPILTLAGKTKKTLVFFNNCHLGSAAKNAVELAKMIIEQEERGR
jgi:uncharacterized protein YecE (DUF72 family)